MTMLPTFSSLEVRYHVWFAPAYAVTEASLTLGTPARFAGCSDYEVLPDDCRNSILDTDWNMYTIIHLRLSET